MFIIRLCAAITLVVLSGCAGSPEVEKPAEPIVDFSKAPPKPAAGDAGKAIDPDVLFMALTAEIAGQRGQYDVAYEGYMEAAKRVPDPHFAERAAMIAMYMRDAKKIDEAMSVWLRQDANNVTARKIAAIAAFKADHTEDAVNHLNALLALEPDGFEATVLDIASGLQKEGKLADLSTALDRLAARNPNKAIIHYLQAILALEQKNTMQADNAIHKALTIQPDWDRALILKAQIALLSGDAAGGKAILQNAAAKYPGNAKFKKMLAQVLIKLEEYDKAGEVYQSLVNADPSDQESRFALGLVHLQQNREDKAEEIFKKMLNAPEWKDRAGYYLGKIAEKGEHYDKALKWYDHVGQGPFAYEAAVASSGILIKTRRYAEAQARLGDMAVRFPKQKLRTALLQADIYSQQKQYQQAFDLLTAALRDAPEQKELLYTRALTAERLGRVDILETDLKKLLERYPDNAEALNALGYTLLNYPDRYSEARLYLEKALRLQPNEAVILDSYGWLQYKLGNTAEALSYLEKAYARQQENEIAAHLAEVLWALGRQEDAKKLFNNAVKQSPNDEYLLDFQQRILNPAP